uniref:Uncharacterized protein n=1 Tax=Eutreptiella gymnastica TaxID=73025 RepID=A0A7S1N853_9EUGL|mmetsp:Transcript_136418/g.236657  ORF Transcript_136418/g.236657 Transcript_136418/m.236657 type:complete len:110 (+) Transcript_136418:131-460(+)
MWRSASDVDDEESSNSSCSSDEEMDSVPALQVKYDPHQSRGKWVVNKCTLIYNCLLNIQQAESYGALVLTGYAAYCVTSGFAAVKRAVTPSPLPWPTPVVGCLPQMSGG